MQPGADKSGRRRGIAAIAVVVYTCALLAFVLPFVSISCTQDGRTVRTESLSGWKLVLGSEPAVKESGEAGQPGASGGVQAKEAIEDALVSVRRATRIEAGIVFVALVLASVAAIKGVPRQLALTLIFIGSIAVIAFFFVLTAGSDAEGSPTVHHHSGLFIAWALTALAFAFELWLMVEIDRRISRRPPVT